MVTIPEYIDDDGQVNWEALFQIYEFEQYRDYANELTRQEVDFIEQVLGLNDGAVVLDVACGGGRHALELARRGYSVEGVERSATLVQYATQIAYQDASRVRFVQTDMREIEYEQQFDAAIIMNSSLGFFDDATNLDLLKRVSDSLVDGGKLLLQCINPYQIVNYLQGFRSGWYQIGSGYVLREASFEPRTATLQMDYRYLDVGRGIDARHTGDRIRLYGYLELMNMLRELNLRPTAVFGDAILPIVPFEEPSQWQVVVAAKNS
jgi:SAM-dependent methyltransferase